MTNIVKIFTCYSILLRLGNWLAYNKNSSHHLVNLYYAADIILYALYKLFNPHRAQWKVLLYHLHYIDEETEAQVS